MEVLPLLWQEDKGGGMMERLTIDEIIEHCERKTKLYEEIGKSINFETIELKGAIREYWEHKQVKEYLEELKQYRDAEKQGLLLRLPCKVGTEVWTIMCGMTGKHPILFKQYFELSMLQYLGEAVFLTQAEAEQKLKEMESD